MWIRTTVWIFQVTNNQNLKDLDMVKKGNFKKETESLSIAAQNNVRRTNYVKVKIDKTRENIASEGCVVIETKQLIT